MSNQRTSLLAAGAALVLVALIAAFILLQDSGPTHDNQPRLTSGASNEAPPSNREPSAPDQGGSDAGKSSPGTTQPTQPAEPTPTPPAAKLLTVARVAGITVDYEGSPLEGITVTLLDENAEAATGPTAISDGEGRFSFECELFEEGTYFVACLMENKAITASETFTVKKDKPVEGLIVQVFDVARAFGVVIGAEDSKPLEGVRIDVGARSDARLQRLGRLLGRVRPIISDAQGQFAIERVAPGRYLVTATKKGWMANELNPLTRDTQEMELAEYANYELLPFVLSRAGIIEGHVLKKSDKSPIPGATVDLGTVLGGSYGVTTTDNTGFYRFETAPPAMGDGAPGGRDGMGGLTVRAMAAGFALGSRNVSVRAGQTRSGVDVLLEDGCAVSGRVLNTKSEPIAGATVYYNDTDFLRGSDMVVGLSVPPRKISTATNDAGEFTLGSLPPGNVRIGATAQGYATGGADAVTVVGTPANLTITLELAGAIFGRVTNERGEPVAGVPIAAFEAAGPGQLSFIMKSFFGESLPDRGDSRLVPPNIRTDDNGAYRLEGLKPAGYVLVANSRDYQKHASPELKVKGGEELEYNFSLVTGGTIHGRVYDAAEKPVAGAAITCAMMNGQESLSVRTAYTDRSGNYELTGLAAGTYTVVRNDGNLAAFFLPNPKNKVTLEPGARVQFDIYDQRPGTARIYGRVTLDGQAYSEKGLVLIGGNRGGFAANNTKTDADGKYEFRSVALGDYQIAQEGRNMPSLVRKRVRVDKAGDIEVNIDFVSVTISGRVEVEGGGVPAGRVRVVATPVNPEGEDSTNPDEEVSDLEMQVWREDNAKPENGEFKITGLSPGFYRLSARSEKNGMVTRPYLNVRASLSGIVLTLPAEGATLKGTVKGLDEAKPNTPFGLIAALTIEDEKGQPIALGGFDNGINLGESKEFSVKNLPEGTLTVTMSLTGYTPVTHKNVQFKAGQTTALEFLFASSGNARMVVQNQDIGIETAFDLQYEIVDSKGQVFKKRFTFLDFFNADGTATQDASTNAFTIKDMPPDTYTITLKLPGYKDVTKQFMVIAGETVEVPVTFEKQ
ncbi:MAG: carboxypeptidase regulatory-like domain-containing protein [Planctomycetes bacterium]|nr:carboxypeptidase regulatory-like domain-containing protein [Planctomycetota bacterium]